jgi:serine/threonine-protein phosphatase 6 regulatory subunit 3
MGHIALIAVDIIGALEKYPDDLLAIVEPLLPQPGWEDYVNGAYAETQRIENIVLGGPKPVSYMRNTQGQGENGWGGEWNDGEDLMSPTGEFRRGAFTGQQTAEFGAPDEEDEGTFNHFNANTGLANNAWGSSSSSDSEDEHEAWIKNSAAAPRHSRDPENVGFDDSFEDNFQPPASTQEYVATTQEEVIVVMHLSHWYTENTCVQDDGFGAFTDADNNTASQFDNDFGHEDFDFGEFHSSEHNERRGVDDEFGHEGDAWNVQHSR